MAEKELEEEGSEEEELVPKSPGFLEIVIKKGHGSNAVLFIRGEPSDKAQFLEVTVNQCKGSGKLPETFVGDVKAALQSHVETLSGPVRGADWLLDLRMRARRAKEDVLGK